MMLISSTFPFRSAHGLRRFLHPGTGRLTPTLRRETLSVLCCLGDTDAAQLLSTEPAADRFGMLLSDMASALLMSREHEAAQKLLAVAAAAHLCGFAALTLGAACAATLARPKHILTVRRALVLVEGLSERVSLPRQVSNALDAARLTPRQEEIAGYVSAGDSPKEIAQRLTISPRPVEGHIAGVLSKFGIRSRSEIATLGLCSLPRNSAEFEPSGRSTRVSST